MLGKTETETETEIEIERERDRYVDRETVCESWLLKSQGRVSHGLSQAHQWMKCMNGLMVFKAAWS